MGFQSVPETVEITIEYIQNLETMANVFHARKIGGYVLADLTLLAGVIDASMVTDLLPLMTLDCSYVRTTVRGLEFENDLETFSNASAGPGIQLSRGMPNSVTLAIKKASGFTGRSARGRWYVVGMPEDTLSSLENSFIAIDVLAFTDAVDDIKSSAVVGGWKPVIVSRFTGGLPRAFGITFDWLTTVAVNGFVDTQRRRLTR